MKNRLRLAFFLASICLLTACPAPEFNHVIVNESKTVLDVEYEYVTGRLREDHSTIANPAKMNAEQYENGGQNDQWINLTAENEYDLATVAEESIVEPNTNQQRKLEVKRVKLKLLPGEVLRVFVSSHINIDLKSLKKISLRGANGSLEIEGAGFEQFSAYRPNGFFTDTKDYRLVYR